jgi:hypothetical protein
MLNEIMDLMGFVGPLKIVILVEVKVTPKTYLH